jgi:competence protein ComEC
MIQRSAFKLICIILALVSAATVSQAAPEKILIVDTDNSHFGEACAAVLAVRPETQVVRIVDDELLESAFQEPWNSVIAVRPDPGSWPAKLGDAWRALVETKPMDILIAGLPSNSEPLLSSLGARSPARVKTTFVRRFDKSSWIWPAGMTSGTALLRGTFNIKELPSFAPLRVSADDGGTVWLNGQKLGEISNWRSSLGMDVSGRLRQGTNVLCIEAKNQDQTGGVVASLQAYDRSGTMIGELLSDRTWRSSSKATDNWTDPAFDDAAWAQAGEVARMFQGPWQGNMPDDDALFKQALRTSAETPSSLTDLGSVVVPAVLEPVAGAEVALLAGGFPVGVRSVGAADQTIVLSAIPDLDWTNTLSPLYGCNAFWDFFLNCVDGEVSTPANAIESFHLPRSLPGGRNCEIAAKFNPSVLAGKAELRLYIAGKAVLTKSQEIPSSGAVLFPVVLPRACDVDRALLVTLTVRDAKGNPADYSAGFVGLTDLVPVSLNNGTNRKVFRCNESIKLVATVASTSMQGAAHWDMRITGEGAAPATGIQAKGECEWLVAPDTLSPGKYSAVASLMAHETSALLGSARFDFEVVKPHGADLLRMPPRQTSPVLQVVSLNVNVKNDIGDAHLIITPSGKVMLIDAGLATYGDDVVLPALNAKGIHKLDWMIPSHMHDDHFGGMSELILNDSIEVKTFLWSPVPLQSMRELESMYAADSERIMKSIQSACKKRNVPMVKLRAGQTLDLGDGVTAEILSTYDSRYRGGNYVNNNSVVMMLKYGDFAMMFTGDQGFEQEQRVMSLGRDLTCDVLKIGHHAGAGSTGEDWVAALGAKVGIAPMPEFLSSDPRGTRVWNQLLPTGMKVYRTWEYGDVTVSSDGKRYWITTEKPGKSPADNAKQ